MKIKYLFALSSAMIFFVFNCMAAGLSSTARENGRRLTGLECARMEIALPATARSIGMGNSFREWVSEATQEEFPEATKAMIRWVAKYNQESLLRYSYEMASDFGNQCRRGKVRTIADPSIKQSNSPLVASAGSARATTLESMKTASLSCYDVWYRYGNTAARSMKELPINPAWKISVPDRCKEDAGSKKALMDGIRSAE